MPYKDPAKQREYLRAWRRNQKLCVVRTPSQRTVRTSPAHPWAVPTVPVSVRAAPALDQRALKMSQDGAPQTGLEATQAFRMHRGQLTTPRTSPPNISNRRAPAVLPKAINIRHVVMPVAAMLVELLSRWC
jgi:hypothetical protein